MRPARPCTRALLRSLACLSLPLPLLILLQPHRPSCCSWNTPVTSSLRAFALFIPSAKNIPPPTQHASLFFTYFTSLLKCHIPRMAYPDLLQMPPTFHQDLCPSLSHLWIYCCSVAKSWPTLLCPVDCSPPGSSVRGIFQARTLEWVAISSSRESS